MDECVSCYCPFSRALDKRASRACLEPQFYSKFCALIVQSLPAGFVPPSGSTRPESATQQKREQWKSTERWIEAAFKTRPRHEWEAVFQGSSCPSTLSVLKLERLYTIRYGRLHRCCPNAIRGRTSPWPQSYPPSQPRGPLQPLDGASIAAYIPNDHSSSRCAYV